MFQWYKQAVICYALLSDVSVESLNETDGVREFGSSRWFTRGWTLQELLAPEKLYFFNSNWKYIGSKSSLKSQISITTGIDELALIHSSTLSTIPVARRMSWAASRVTTRPEDIAYCLLGLFDVNMPLLYGEGERAFIRLQEEILRETEDYTILAWEFAAGTAQKRAECANFDALGILARHPSFFKDSTEFLNLPGSFGWLEPCVMTNKGLRLRLPLYKSMRRNQETISAILPCARLIQTRTGLSQSASFIAQSRDGLPNTGQSSMQEKTLVYTAIPLTVSNNSIGTLGRSLRNLTQVWHDKIVDAEFHTIFLSKMDYCAVNIQPDYSVSRLFSVPAKFTSASFSDRTAHNPGILIPTNEIRLVPKVFFMGTPLTTLSAISEGAPVIEDMQAKFELPHNTTDYVIAFQYVNTDEDPDSLTILVESRGHRRVWSLKLFKSGSSLEDITSLIKENVGRFSSAYDTLTASESTLNCWLFSVEPMVEVRGSFGDASINTSISRSESIPTSDFESPQKTRPIRAVTAPLTGTTLSSSLKNLLSEETIPWSTVPVTNTVISQARGARRQMNLQVQFLEKYPTHLVDRTLATSWPGHWHSIVISEAYKSWPPRHFKMRKLQGHKSGVHCIAFSPDSKLFASAGSISDPAVRIWDPKSEKQLKVLEGTHYSVHSIAFSPDSNLLAFTTGGMHNMLYLWNLGSDKALPLRGIDHLEAPVYSVAFSPDGQTILSGSGDDVVRLWDAATGELLRDEMIGYKAVFSPDGQMIVSAAAYPNPTVFLWNANTGTLIRALAGHSAVVYSVCFSPNGQMVASSSADQTVRLWDIHTGKLIRKLEGHSGEVLGIAFSADGQILASAGGKYDQTVLLWDVASGRLLERLEGHMFPVQDVVFSADGLILASCSTDMSVRLWEIS